MGGESVCGGVSLCVGGVSLCVGGESVWGVGGG